MYMWAWNTKYTVITIFRPTGAQHRVGFQHPHAGCKRQQIGRTELVLARKMASDADTLLRLLTHTKAPHSHVPIPDLGQFPPEWPSYTLPILVNCSWADWLLIRFSNQLWFAPTESWSKLAKIRNLYGGLNTHSLKHSLTHSNTRSLTHSNTHSLTHSNTHSL